MFLVWAYESVTDLGYEFKMHSRRGYSVEAVEIIAQDTPGRSSDPTHVFLYCRWYRMENLAADIIYYINSKRRSVSIIPTFMSLN